MFKNSLKRYAEIVKLAKDNGGDILTTEWLGTNAIYKCKLSNGYIVNRRGSILLNGQWPENIKVEAQVYYERIKELAIRNNGKILTPNWQGSTVKYQCLLSTGLIVERLGSALLNGYWTPRSKKPILPKDSFIKKQKEPPKVVVQVNRIKIMNDLAEARGGRLLDTIWKGSEEFYNFEDSAGNKFRMRGKAGLRGSWSLKAGKTTEPLCRQIMESIFETNFPSRWDILTPELTGRPNNLELDGYSEKLNVAFEYQGFPSHWRQNHPNYHKTKVRDEAKVHACKLLGIKLIIIPPYNKNIFKKDAFFKHVLDIVYKAYADNPSVLNKLNSIPCEFDLSKLGVSITDLQKFKALVAEHGMSLLNNTYKGMDTTHGIVIYDKYVVLRTYRTIKHTTKHHGLPVILHGELTSYISNFEKFKQILTDLKCSLKQPGWYGTDHDYEVSTPHGDCTLSGKIIATQLCETFNDNPTRFRQYVMKRQIKDSNRITKLNNKTKPLLYDLAECTLNPSLY